MPNLPSRSNQNLAPGSNDNNISAQPARISTPYQICDQGPAAGSGSARPSVARTPHGRGTPTQAGTLPQPMGSPAPRAVLICASTLFRQSAGSLLPQLEADVAAETTDALSA